MSRPRLNALTPNPTNAVMIARARKAPRTRNPNVTSAARLSIVAPEVGRRDNPKPGRHDLEDPWEFSGDLAVERYIHRLGWPYFQPRNLERANATDAAAHANGGIDRRSDQATDRQGVGPDGGQPSLLGDPAPEPPVRGNPPKRGACH